MEDKSNTNLQREEIKLTQLFWLFLKIGSTSFGGFMALVSVIQNEMVEKAKMLKNEVILDGISLASIVPGPLAVNVVTYVGYHLRGIKGALVSMLAVILPTYILVYALSVIYFRYGDIPAFTNVFLGIMAAVTVIIISVAINMLKKTIKDYKQILISVLSGIVLLFFGGVYLTLLIIMASGFLGYLFYYKKEKESNGVIAERSYNVKPIIGLLVAVFLVVTAFLALPYVFPAYNSALMQSLSDIILVFSSMSLTLFGGGYVIIPTMQEVIVENLNWLSSQEFTDGIAMGQITPGPILISAAFIGYKVAGFWGSVVATISIFLPTGLVMIIGSSFLVRIKNSQVIQSIFKGLRPAVIGMIFSAAFTIGKELTMAWQTAAIFFVIALLLFRFKVNVVYLIPLAGVLGYFLYN